MAEDVIVGIVIIPGDVSLIGSMLKLRHPKTDQCGDLLLFCRVEDWIYHLRNVIFLKTTSRM